MSPNHEELILSLLIELKEDVGELNAKVSEMTGMRADIDKLKRDVNVVRGVALAIGAAFSLVIALYTKIFKG
jgi:hypothetical protein